jgi:hypothetical protein
MQTALPSTYFTALSSLGFKLLWGELVRNGTAQSIRSVTATGQHQDGSLLRRHFTGWGAIDAYMLSPVVFYHGLTSGQHAASRLLLVAMFSTMQSTAVCMLAPCAAAARGYRRVGDVM